MTDTRSTLTWLLLDHVTGPAKDMTRSLDDAGKHAANSGSLMDKLSAATGGMITPTSLAMGAVTGLVGFLGLAAHAAAEEEINVQKMTKALEASVPGFDGNTDAIEELIKKREDLAFSDDELRQSFATLVTSTHDVNQAADLQATAMDLARLKGVDLATASEALAKANVGSTRELKALGIAVDDSKDKTQVFTAIQKAAAGQAQAYASTTSAKWQEFQNKLGDVTEDVGSMLLPVLTGLADFATDVLIPTIGGVVGIIEGIAGAIGVVVGAVGDFFASVNAGRETSHHEGMRVVPGRARGGPVEAGETYMVGEGGPELFVPRQAGTIVPGGTSSGAPVEIPVIIDGREVARVIDERLFYSMNVAIPRDARA